MAQGSIKDRAHELSSFVNAAYTTLSNHIERAEYLIKLSGNAKNGDDEIAKHEEEVIADDPDLVERIFELRMTIAETDGMEDVIEIKTALERDYKEELGKLTATFTSGQESFCRNFERRQIINRARYLIRMLEEVNEREDQIKAISGEIV